MTNAKQTVGSLALSFLVRGIISIYAFLEDVVTAFSCVLNG